MLGALDLPQLPEVEVDVLGIPDAPPGSARVARQGTGEALSLGAEGVVAPQGTYMPHPRYTEEARAAKRFAEADQIRDELAAEGVVIEDTPDGPRWRRG